MFYPDPNDCSPQTQLYRKIAQTGESICKTLGKIIVKKSRSQWDVPWQCKQNQTLFFCLLKNASRNQERHLDTLHNFVSRATRELIWLNEKEEEEVAHDWSERNTNIARKKEYHAVRFSNVLKIKLNVFFHTCCRFQKLFFFFIWKDLMRELDQKEEVIKSVQEIAEQLLFENHPARLTIEVGY